MYYNSAAYGAEGGGIKVEGAVEGFPSGEEGSDGGQAEKVEVEFGLREEFVPQVVWEVGRDASKDAEEVCFEGADGTFGYVASMDVGGTSWYVATQMSVTWRQYSLLASLSRT